MRKKIKIKPCCRNKLIPVIIILASAIIISLGNVQVEWFQPDSTNVGDSRHQEIEPCEDISPPKIREIFKTPSYPGPTSGIEVTAVISDDSSPLAVSALYGYDNANWNNLSTIRSEAPEEFGDGNYSYSASIPPAGTNPKVYFYFNATDPSNNSVESSVQNFSIDSVKPVIINCTSFNVTYRGATTLWIYSNVSDNSQVFETYLNWSKDNITWFLVKMEVVTGSGKLIEFRGPLSVPQVNTTYFYRIEVLDEGGNRNASLSAQVQWNPPPRIDQLSYTPPHPNSSTIVTASAVVDDIDSISKVWVKYSTDKVLWTSVNATGSGSKWSADIGPIMGSVWVEYKFLAKDIEGGQNESSIHKYYVDGQSPKVESIIRTPDHPGPTTNPTVVAIFSDDSNPLAVIANYGYDNKTWTNLSTIRSDAPEGYGEGTFSYTATIPSAGTNPKVYFFFNATDPSNNSADSPVHNYSIDFGKPIITNFTSFTTTYRGSSTLWIFTNITDDCRVLEAFLNWSTDNSTWFVVKMEISSGSGKLIEFKSPILTPQMNSTFYYKIEAFDEGCNCNVSINAWFVWNPPPQIRQVDYFPKHPNNGTSVNVTSTIWDDDGVSSMWVLYSKDQSAWTRVNGSKSIAEWYAIIPSLIGTSHVYYRVFSNDIEMGVNNSGLFSYHIDETPPMIGAPSISPTFPNASVPVLVSVSVSDAVGVRNSTLAYRNEGGGWNYVALNLVDGSYQGMVPRTSVSSTVHYKIYSTDLSDLTTRSPLHNYSTDGGFPNVTLARRSPSPPVWDRAQGFPVWINITDDVHIGGASVFYSFDNGTTRSSKPLEHDHGNELIARWTGTIPAAESNLMVDFYYLVYDRAKNHVRHPWSTDSFYQYYASDRPTISDISHTPLVANATTTTTIVGTVTDLDDVTMTELLHRLDSGQWDRTNMTHINDNEWSAVIQSPGFNSNVSYYFHATDNVGLLTVSSIYQYRVDTDSPAVELVSRKPDIANATSPIKIMGEATDITTSISSVSCQYRYGEFGNVNLLSTKSEGNNEYSASIPSSGYSVWIYYRLVALDEANNEEFTEWARCWVDIIPPFLGGDNQKNWHDASKEIDISCRFIDEWAMDRASVFYSYGGGFHEVKLTKRYYNGTHLGATGDIPQTRIPMNVSYYLKFWDKAGNWNTTQPYITKTRMNPIKEGVDKRYDASQIDCQAGYKDWEWDFEFDGSFNIDGRGQYVSHMYLDDGNYTVALRLTDKTDNITLHKFPLNVTDESPEAKILNPGDVSEYDTVTLDGSISNSFPDIIVSYEWDIEYDGIFTSDAEGSKVQYKFKEDRTYIIALRVVDDDGSTCIATLTIDVLDLSPSISVEFPQTTNEGTQVSFNATSTTSWPDSLGSLEWDFEYDGIFQKEDTGAVVTYTFMDDGNHRFCLQAYDSDGSYSEFIGTISVQDLAPTANFTVDSPTVEGSPVIFNGTSSFSYPDKFDRYEWDFQYDGSFSPSAHGAKITWTFMDNGSIWVAFRVTDDDGSIAIKSMRIQVSDLEPTAVIVAPTSVDEGTIVKLNASTSLSYPDDIILFEWDFDFEGNSFTSDAMGRIVKHVYMDNGSFYVALRVTDEDGSMDQIFSTIVVADLAPKAVLEIHGVNTEGLILLLDAGESESYPDEITTYRWDIDYEEGKFTQDLEGKRPSHIYLDNGTYTVALKVIDSDGSIALVTRTITIADMSPKAVLLVEKKVVPEGKVLTFDASQTQSYPDDVLQYRWDWDGDGEFDEITQGAICDHIFTSPSMNDVILTVLDEDGSTSNVFENIKVTNVGPVARAVVNSTTEGSMTLLDARSSTEPGDDLAHFRWDINGDGSWDSYEPVWELDPVWTSPGVYEITLEVEDVDGSVDRVIVSLIVTDVPPVANVGGPYEVNEGETLTLSAVGTTEPGLDFVAFKWDFDSDGIFEILGIESEVEWVWEIAGVQHARLVVEDTDGSSDEITFDVQVNDLPPTFEWDLQMNLVEGVPSRFDLIGLHDPGTSFFEVVWYMGDGTKRNGVEVEHVYQDQGSFQGHVTVKDNDGDVYRMDWPEPLIVDNGAPIVEIRIGDPQAIEDQEFTLKVFALDVDNDTVTFSHKDARGSIDPETGLFTWTPGNKDVGQNSITFFASDEDGGTGELTIVITVKDVDNDFFGISFVLGSLIIILIMVCILAVLVVKKKSFSGSSKKVKMKNRK